MTEAMIGGGLNYPLNIATRKLPGQYKLNFINFEKIEEILGDKEKTLALAILLCKLIPPTCPMETKIQLAGKIFTIIPKLCNLNPYHYEIEMLRLGALFYLDGKLTSEQVIDYSNSELNRMEYILRIPEMLILTLRLVLSDDVYRVLTEELRFIEMYSKNE